jgi:hypothetical protein
MTQTETQTPQQAAIALLPEPVTEGKLATTFGVDEALHEIHNFDLTDPDDSLRYVAAVAGDALALLDAAGTDIEVVNFHCRPIEMVRPDSGEVVRTLRTVLVTSEGDQLHTVSPVAARTIAALWRSGLGKKQFKPPIKLSVRQVKTAAKFKCLVLTPVLPKVGGTTLSDPG